MPPKPKNGQPMTAAERMRAKRLRDAKPKTVPLCGTRAAYMRHLRNGEEPDELCKMAQAKASRAQYRATGRPERRIADENIEGPSAN